MGPTVNPALMVDPVFEDPELEREYRARERMLELLLLGVSFTSAMLIAAPMPILPQKQGPSTTRTTFTLPYLSALKPYLLFIYPLNGQPPPVKTRIYVTSVNPQLEHRI